MHNSEEEYMHCDLMLDAQPYDLSGKNTLMGEALDGDLHLSYYPLHEQDLNIAMGSNWNDEYGQESLSNPWFSTPSDYFTETTQIGYGLRAVEKFVVPQQVATASNIGGEITYNQILPADAASSTYYIPVSDTVHTDNSGGPQYYPSEDPLKKATTKRQAKFFCDYIGCSATFTTNYRLKTHVNRFHTPEPQQQQYFCNKCGLYKTYYSTDRTRHEKTCGIP